jgi:UDP-N-acetylmuramate dehydrogenase
VPLAPLTTLGVGGPARLLLEVAHETEIAAALAWAERAGHPLVVLGGGSNVLIADRGLDALVLRVRITGIEVERSDGRVSVTVGAGMPWDPLVDRAVAEGWAGIECLSGIPGDVGGTPIQNVGAYGQEVAQTIESVQTVDRRDGTLVTLDTSGCGFGYRDSIFKRQARERYVVTRVRFGLAAGGAADIRYGELARYLGMEPAAEPRSIQALPLVRAAVLELRRRKSMVIDPEDDNRRSAGSFFTNPVVDTAAAGDVRARVEALGVLGAGETMPEFPAAGGKVKLSAGWLIERAGFAKGTIDGRVGLSTRHALAVVNRGGATAAELVAFAGRVRAGVLERFGVSLTPEPVLLGFTSEELAEVGL